jgi:uncharacterized protein
MRPSASYWIEKLSLQKHVEGGFYKRIYCSGIKIPAAQLPAVFKGERPIATSIYFLLEAGEFSAMHRIASDELWHFYSGDCLLIYEIEADGSLTNHLLGNNYEAGETFQCAIKAGSWFGAILKNGDYALAGCTVSPGFDFEDFELAKPNVLLELYPQHQAIIKMLTHKNPSP